MKKLFSMSLLVFSVFFVSKAKAQFVVNAHVGFNFPIPVPIPVPPQRAYYAPPVVYQQPVPYYNDASVYAPVYRDYDRCYDRGYRRGYDRGYDRDYYRDKHYWKHGRKW